MNAGEEGWRKFLGTDWSDQNGVWHHWSEIRQELEVTELALLGMPRVLIAARKCCVQETYSARHVQSSCGAYDIDLGSCPRKKRYSTFLVTNRFLHFRHLSTVWHTKLSLYTRCLPDTFQALFRDKREGPLNGRASQLTIFLCSERIKANDSLAPRGDGQRRRPSPSFHRVDATKAAWSEIGYLHMRKVYLLCEVRGHFHEWWRAL